MAKWKKGESGNPGGRPRGHGDIREKARAYGEDAIKVLADVMNDPEAAPSARQAAAVALLDRGYGRPELNVTASVTPGVSYSDELQRIADLLRERQQAIEADRSVAAAVIEDKSES
jgi:hypothetical protein